MHTLKVQLGLTLSIVISLAMLLFGIVLLMLWQQNALQQQTAATKDFLQLSATILEEAGDANSSRPQCSTTSTITIYTVSHGNVLTTQLSSNMAVVPMNSP